LSLEAENGAGDAVELKVENDEENGAPVLTGRGEGGTGFEGSLRFMPARCIGDGVEYDEEGKGPR
jgi:hypothetical protein